MCQLLPLAPDVDDLESIDALEQYIDQSQVLLTAQQRPPPHSSHLAPLVALIALGAHPLCLQVVQFFCSKGKPCAHNPSIAA